MWASEHRYHHKYVDHDDDPYNINKGFFHAHIGWLLFKLQSEHPYDNVSDLQKDPLVRLAGSLRAMDRGRRRLRDARRILGYYVAGGWVGALGGFLFGGVARVVAVQHCTFFINSACHTLGDRPYSDRCSARDSGFMAVLTFGEGYHNYHHEFQHDYRNGVKPWQWDPTKWAIWLLSKVGLTNSLRRVPSEKILLAEIAQTQTPIGSQVAGQDGELAGVHRDPAASFAELSAGTEHPLGRPPPRVREGDRADVGALARGHAGVARGTQDGAGSSEVREDDRVGSLIFTPNSGVRTPV